MAAMMTEEYTLLDLRPFTPLTRASRANMPPSPLLSARSRKMTYLKHTTTTTVQKSSEMTPKTLPWLTGMAWLPLKHSFMEYRGLVPMSPNTTPREPTMRPRFHPLGGAG